MSTLFIIDTQADRGREHVARRNQTMDVEETTEGMAPM